MNGTTSPSDGMHSDSEIAPHFGMHGRSEQSGTASPCSADVSDRYGSVRSIRPLPAPDENANYTSQSWLAREVVQGLDKDRRGNLAVTCPPPPQPSPISPKGCSGMSDAEPAISTVPTVARDCLETAWTAPPSPSPGTSLQATGADASATGQPTLEQGRNLCSMNTPSVDLVALQAPDTRPAVQSQVLSPSTAIYHTSSMSPTAGSYKTCSAKADQKSGVTFTDPSTSVFEGMHGTSTAIADNGGLLLPVLAHRIVLCRSSCSTGSADATKVSSSRASSSATSLVSCELFHPPVPPNTPRDTEGPSGDVTPVVPHDSPGDLASTMARIQRALAHQNPSRMPPQSVPHRTATGAPSVRCGQEPVQKSLLDWAEPGDGTVTGLPLLLLLCLSVNLLLCSAFVVVVMFYFISSDMRLTLP